MGDLVDMDKMRDISKGYAVSSGAGFEDNVQMVGGGGVELFAW